MNKKSKIFQFSLLASAFSTVLGISACNKDASTQANNQPQQAQSQAPSNADNKLSAEDVSLLFKTLPAQNQQMLVQQPEQVKNFLDDLKILLAVSEEAKRSDWVNEPEVKQQLDFVETSVIATEFERSKNGGNNEQASARLFADIKPEEIQGFYQDPANESRFNAIFDSMKKRMLASGNPKKDFSEAEVNQLRENWAKMVLTERKAREAGFDKKRETQLQVNIQQARYLAQEYARRSEDKMAVSDAEVADYLKQHPELDSTKKREQAEQVLKRAKAGEDFAKLADEFSEDPGNADPNSGQKNGGLYKDVKKGQMVPEFEAAALGLENGKVADNLVETPYGFHIIKLENKNGDTYSVRHILFMNSAPGSNPYSKPMSFTDKAREDLKSQKRDKWLEEVTARNPISLPRPEEVKIEAPPISQMPAQPQDAAPSNGKKSK